MEYLISSKEKYVNERASFRSMTLTIYAFRSQTENVLFCSVDTLPPVSIPAVFSHSANVIQEISLRLLFYGPPGVCEGIPVYHASFSLEKNFTKFRNDPMIMRFRDSQRARARLNANSVVSIYIPTEIFIICISSRYRP